MRADLDIAAVKERNAIYRRRCMSRDGSHWRWNHHVPQRRQQQLVAVYDGHSTAAAHRGLLAEMHLQGARTAQGSRVIYACC